MSKFTATLLVEMELTKVLKDVFGYQSFRGKQEEVIHSVMEGHDALVIMPTGGGKSLCYQLPALCLDGLTVVVSPLIALMNDQVASLRQLDVRATALHSHNGMSYASIRSGNYQLLYMSPERILGPGGIEFLRSMRISLFAIDEAHCVSVWGNDFRPEYARLAELRQHFPDVPLLALTATADHATQQDIIKQLNLTCGDPFVSSFERANITTAAQPGIKRAEQIMSFLALRPAQAGIIYCLSRKSTEQMAQRLVRNGHHAAAYHAGLDGSVRREVQRRFQDDELAIVCATIAFGMGIDKPNIRWIIHYNMPKNLEGYYQEIGRAGRDGEPAEALLFYSWADYQNLLKFIDGSEANPAFLEVQRAKLSRMWEYATTLNCRTNLVLSYFGEYGNASCGHCDNCNNPPELFDGTQYAQMALSGIARAKERVGTNLLIDILRGANKNEVYRHHYDRLKTFGVGRMVPFVHWRYYITQLLNQGLISIDYIDNSRLRLTPLSGQVLRGSRSVELARFIKKEEKANKEATKTRTSSLLDKPVDDKLLQRLKQWRSARARSQKVPAYVVLHDKSLRQIAATRPMTDSQLLIVEGIGEAKLQKYGAEIRELVKKSGD